MAEYKVVRDVEVARSPRVAQVEGIFDLPASKTSHVEIAAELPLDERPWTIGAIVGPSGSGKSTLLDEVFGIPEPHDWPADASVLDGFPPDATTRDIVGLLSSVGFSSPPSWLRPFHTLSNGEQFRVSIARALAEDREPTVIDEFTSVVDRTVAQIGSAAIAKYVRRSGRTMVVGSCHFDIIDWLQPDWVYDCGGRRFEWRSLQRRPNIDLEIIRAPHSAWDTFARHHYLTGHLNKNVTCWVALVEDQPAAFTAVLHWPTRSGVVYRGHRTVCLPDYQGVGIGNALTEKVASIYKARGFGYYVTTSHPAMIHHRARSPKWLMIRKPNFGNVNKNQRVATKTVSVTRLTASFRYVGPPAPEDETVLMDYGWDLERLVAQALRRPPRRARTRARPSAAK